MCRKSLQKRKRKRKSTIWLTDLDLDLDRLILCFLDFFFLEWWWEHCSRTATWNSLNSRILSDSKVIASKAPSFSNRTRTWMKEKYKENVIITFSLRTIFKQIYLTYRRDPNRFYHSESVDLGVMAIKGYTRSPELELHHQMQFSVILMTTLLERVLTLCRVYSQRILSPANKVVKI